MRAELDYNDESARATSLLLEREWERLCAAYLPITPSADRIWRYSRGLRADDPSQGWKLHVSANVLAASKTLKKVAPLLQERGMLFKAPSSLRELRRINCGLFYGYSQVGKFITAYPRSSEEAVALAGQLHKLTYGMNAPSVPFDSPFQPGSSVYYRYGAFRHIEMQNADGTPTPAIRDPDGNLVPDLRTAESAAPDWATDPFNTEPARPDSLPVESPLRTSYRAVAALAQRGKGGVYKAIDLTVYPPRICILKEGRAGGEIGWDERDGHWRVRHEERVLTCLRAAGIEVPHVYSSFEVQGNYYLALELMQGETLQSILSRRRRRLSVPQSLLYGAQLASLMARIHGAGWAWRDCKPANLMVTKGGELRPLDFEGACLIEQPDPSPWITTAFAPPSLPSSEAGPSCVQYDLYALGATLYLLLTGELPKRPTATPVEKLRSHIPSNVRELIRSLLDAYMPGRLAAATVAAELAAATPSPVRR